MLGDEEMCVGEEMREKTSWQQFIVFINDAIYTFPEQPRSLVKIYYT